MTTCSRDSLLYKEREVCGVLHISRTSLRRLMVKGYIRPLKIGRAIRFMYSDVLALVERLRVEAAEQAAMADVKAIRAALQCGRSGCPCVSKRGSVHCPGHDDEHPSLSVTEKGGKTLVKCHTGCSQPHVLAKLRVIDCGGRGCISLHKWAQPCNRHADGGRCSLQ
jgi:hypothetical protein